MLNYFCGKPSLLFSYVAFEIEQSRDCSLGYSPDHGYKGKALFDVHVKFDANIAIEKLLVESFNR